MCLQQQQQQWTAAARAGPAQQQAHLTAATCRTGLLMQAKLLWCQAAALVQARWLL
jgi:hypothetical protein